MKLKMLCIDDSKSIQALLKHYLTEITSEIRFASDGEEGVEVFKKNPQAAFDLILLDWEMPKKTGPEVLAEIKKMNIQTPVIMLTSKNLPSEIESMLNLGAYEYIMKPFTKDILLEKISTLFPNLSS